MFSYYDWILEELCEVAKTTKKPKVRNIFQLDDSKNFREYVVPIIKRRICDRYKSNVYASDIISIAHNFFDRIYVNSITNPNFISHRKVLDKYLKYFSKAKVNNDDDSCSRDNYFNSEEDDNRKAAIHILQLAANSRSEWDQKRLAQRKNFLINLALSENDNLSKEVFDHLAKLDNESVSISLTRNRRLPKSAFNSIMARAILPPKTIDVTLTIALLLAPSATIIEYQNLFNRIKEIEKETVGCMVDRSYDSLGISDSIELLYARDRFQNLLWIMEPLAHSERFPTDKLSSIALHHELMQDYSEDDILMIFNMIKNSCYTGKEPYLAKLLIANFSGDWDLLRNVREDVDNNPRIVREVIKFRDNMPCYKGFTSYFHDLNRLLYWKSKIRFLDNDHPCKQHFLITD